MIPADVMVLAEKARDSWVDGTLKLEIYIAKAIMEDRQVRLPIARGLTPRQLVALRFITRFSDEFGVSPTYRDINMELGLKSLSAIHRLVEKLVEAGAISHKRMRRRSLVVLQAPPPTILQETPE